MARTKKFKTVAGYLRSMENDLYYQQERAKREGRSAISDDEGQRQIINNLLRQIGVAVIEQTESPLAGVKRLRQATNEAQGKTLDACLKWLTQPTVHAQFIGATVSKQGVSSVARTSRSKSTKLCKTSAAGRKSR